MRNNRGISYEKDCEKELIFHNLFVYDGMEINILNLGLWGSLGAAWWHP